MGGYQRPPYQPPAPLCWGVVEWSFCGCSYRLVGLFPTRAQAAVLAAQHAGSGTLFRAAPTQIPQDDF
jgi:hypothetical protein